MGAFERSSFRGSSNDRQAVGTLHYTDGLGQKMRQLRKQRGLTQRTLAERLGVSTPAVCRWESGQASPRRENVQAFANAFGLSESELLSLLGPDPVDVAAGAHFAEMTPVTRASDDGPAKQEDLLKNLLVSCKRQIADAAGTTPERVKIVIEI